MRDNTYIPHQTTTSPFSFHVLEDHHRQWAFESEKALDLRCVLQHELKKATEQFLSLILPQLVPDLERRQELKRLCTSLKKKDQDTLKNLTLSEEKYAVQLLLNQHMTVEEKQRALHIQTDNNGDTYAVFESCKWHRQKDNRKPAMSADDSRYDAQERRIPAIKEEIASLCVFFRRHKINLKTLTPESRLNFEKETLHTPWPHTPEFDQIKKDIQHTLQLKEDDRKLQEENPQANKRLAKNCKTLRRQRHASFQPSDNPAALPEEDLNQTLPEEGPDQSFVSISFQKPPASPIISKSSRFDLETGEKIDTHQVNNANNAPQATCFPLVNLKANEKRGSEDEVKNFQLSKLLLSLKITATDTCF